MAEKAIHDPNYGNYENRQKAFLVRLFDNPIPPDGPREEGPEWAQDVDHVIITGGVDAESGPWAGMIVNNEYTEFGGGEPPAPPLQNFYSPSLPVRIVNQGVERLQFFVLASEQYRNAVELVGATLPAYQNVELRPLIKRITAPEYEEDVEQFQYISFSDVSFYGDQNFTQPIEPVRTDSYEIEDGLTIHAYNIPFHLGSYYYIKINTGR